MAQDTYFKNYESEATTSEIDKIFWDYFDVSSTSTSNVTWDEVQPHARGLVLTTYGILLAIGGIGNIAVLVTLARSKRRSRVDLMMTHLALADVCVTCGVIPLEIGWKYTNAWLVGNVLCKILLVIRAFGLYLSSNVLVCISIDRFFAVIYPLRLPVARRRSRQMLYGAWAIALACSLPQSFVFRVMQHPRVAGFEQCVSFDAFSTEAQEVAYNVFCMSAMYFLPLVIITVCYMCIFCKISHSSKELDEKCMHQNGVSSVRLRRSDRRVLERARRRMLRMTVTIVCVFAFCWLPYAIMAMWYMIDRESASRVSPRVQDLLFAMAVSNSCMNPLVYGSYTLDLQGTIRRVLKKYCCRSSSTSDTERSAPNPARSPICGNTANTYNNGQPGSCPSGARARLTAARAPAVRSTRAPSGAARVLQTKDNASAHVNVDRVNNNNWTQLSRIDPQDFFVLKKECEEKRLTRNRFLFK